jgi:hypothetical protein
MRPSVSRWFDSQIRIWRPTTVKDSVGVEERTYVSIATVGCRINRSVTADVPDSGGQAPDGTVRWYGLPTIDVKVRDVCEVISGPDAGHTWEVNQIPVRPAGHHTQVDCVDWHGRLISHGTGGLNPVAALSGLAKTILQKLRLVPSTDLDGIASVVNPAEPAEQFINLTLHPTTDAHGVGVSQQPTDLLRLAIGDANIAGLWTGHKNVTKDGGGVVSAWADVRGGAFVATFAQATAGKRPVWSIGGDGVEIVTFDGVDDSMLAAVGGLAYIGATTLAIIAKPKSSTALTQFAEIEPSGVTSTPAYMAIGVSTSGGFLASTEFRAGSVNSTVLASVASRRLMILTQTANTSDVTTFQVPNKVSGTISGSAQNFGWAQCRIGCQFFTSSGGTELRFGAMDLVAVIILKRVATAGDVTALKNFAAALNYVPA